MTKTSIRISSGKLVDLANFHPEDVCLKSITRSLNEIRRFTGHYTVKRPLTVAEHTALTFKIATVLYPSDFPVHLGCLLHDMPEAYYGDFSSPLKRFMQEDATKYFEDIDATVWASLWFLEPSAQTDFVMFKVKQCDTMSLKIEQLNIWNLKDFDYYKELTEEEQLFCASNPVDNWFDQMSDTQFDLEAMYNQMKGKVMPNAD